MNLKAFTLIELLAVIIILGIVLAIAVPNVLDAVDNSKTDVYKVKEDGMEKGAKDYALYNDIELPVNIGDRINIGLSLLITDNFVTKINDFNDNSLCSGYVYIEKTHIDNFSYNACLFCTNYSTDNVVCNIEEAE